MKRLLAMIALGVAVAYLTSVRPGHDAPTPDDDFDRHADEAPPPPPPPPSGIPGFDHAIFDAGHIHIQGSAGTDSWDSSVGSYAITHACNHADVGTNSTSPGDLDVAGAATVCGDAHVGHGGIPAVVIVGAGLITGTKTPQNPTNKALPPASVPPLPFGAPFNPTFSGGAHALAPGFNYGQLQCTAHCTVTLDAGVYVFSEIDLTGGSTLAVATGAVSVYFTSQLQLGGGSLANATGVPANLVFYGGPTATQIDVQGGASAMFAAYAPSCDCNVEGGADVYGAMTCHTMDLQGGSKLHYDKALAGFGLGTGEVSRASPVVAQIAGQAAVVQGTFTPPAGVAPVIASLADVGAFAFPFIKGHVRARTVASVGAASGFASGTVLFDATVPPVVDGGCAAFDGSCRNVFTITQAPAPDGTNVHPPRVALSDANASAIGALIAPAAVIPGIGAAQWQTIVRDVTHGSLGGVDRSTVAVVPPSTLAGVGTRPTIAYVGGTDGMVHAICASVGGTTPSQVNICPTLGTELWAFMPRAVLPLVRTNTARIDGSVRVIDAVLDDTGSGTIAPHTLLVFQTGAQGVGTPPAVDELDITDPAAPYVVWETTAPAAPGPFAIGAGLTVAAGAVHTDAIHELAFVETNNGGTGGTGVVTTALAMETGHTAWQFGYAYPAPPRGIPADMPLPMTGIPGGAVGVDLGGEGFVTDVVQGDLFGNAWRLDAATGVSKTGAGVPLFSFVHNKHPIGAPPALFSNGSQQFVAFPSGGYDDPFGATWSAGTQSLVAVKLTAATTVHDTAPVCATCDLVIREDLTGFGGFAQAVVIGTQLFVTSDTNDVNSSAFGSTAGTGHLTAVDLSSGAATTVVLGGAGASSLANSGTTMVSSSGQSQEVATVAATTVGPKVDFDSTVRTVRGLWLRTE